jgi:hypothetical protein
MTNTKYWGSIASFIYNVQEYDYCYAIFLLNKCIFKGLQDQHNIHTTFYNVFAN